jgi:hypothetical protein
MLNSRVIVTFAALFLLTLGISAQSSGTITLPVHPAPGNDAHQMYVNYCAACHGLDGRGRGPVAPSLALPPSDLTLLSRTNGGRFPTYRVQSVLRFGPDTPSTVHGSKDMPVWGSVFHQMNHGVLSSREEEDLRVTNLSRYLESLQIGLEPTHP